MTDRELLELAAKAAGYHHTWNEQYECLEVWEDGWKNKKFWQPHRDDGDALRLRNRMKMTIIDEGSCIYAEVPVRGGPVMREPYDRDLEGGYASHVAVDAATRRAIVRAAAEIGRSMP